MKNIIKVLFIISTVGLVVIVTGCAAQPEEQTSSKTTMHVASTLFPIHDIAQTIGGDHVTSHVILPPGASPHTFSPTPSDIRHLENTRLLFVVGHGIDGWASTVTDSLGEVKTIDVSKDISLHSFTHEHEHEHENENEHEHEHENENEHEHEHENENENENEHEHDHDESEHHHTDEHETIDPHYWLNTENGITIASTITDALCTADPDHAEHYKENLATYTQDLKALHTEITDTLNDLDNRDLLVFHDSWNYFAREFNLTIAGVFQTSPGKEPSPRYLEELYNHAQEHNVRVVFSEPQLSPATLRPFIEDLGLEMYVLDPLGGLEERDSYINMLRYNAKTIYEALST